MLYPVVEIFDSIQGEGRFIGAPCTFVRLAGCPLNCSFCDTDKEAKYSLNALQISLRCSSDRIVVITGGEPLIHDLEPLLEELHNTLHRVHIETSGTFPRPYPFRSSEVEWVSVSPKKGHPLRNNYYDEVKWLVPMWSLHEIDWALSGHHFVQPVNTKRGISKKNMALCVEYVLKEPRLRLSPQLHKLIHVR